MPPRRKSRTQDENTTNVNQLVPLRQQLFFPSETLQEPPHVHTLTINDSHRLADRQTNYLYFRSLLTSERKKFCILSKIRTYYFAKLYLCISIAVNFSYEQTPGFKSLKFTVFMFFKFYRTVFCYYLLIVSVVLLYINSSVWANEAKCI